MPARRLLHARVWLSLAVLVHLVAPLMPAGSAFASDDPSAPCVLSRTVAASAFSGVVPDATQEVIIPKDRVDLSIYIANWRDRLTDAKQIENLLMDLFVIYSHKITGNDGTALDRYREAYDRAIQDLSVNPGFLEHHDLVLHTMLNTALDIPELATAVPFIFDELIFYGIGVDRPRSDHEIGSSAIRYSLADRLLERGPELLARVYGCARNNPAVSEAIDKYFAREANASIGDSASEVLEKNPNLPVSSTLRNGIREDGTISISLDELKNLTEAEFRKIHASINDIRATLVEIDEKQNVIIDYLQDLELRERHRKMVEQKDTEHRLKLDAARASVSILTMLMGEIDPKAAHDFSIVAGASVQVGAAISGWLRSIGGASTSETITSLSTIAMTGNILGAVMNLVSLFGDPEVSPEQMILEEIGMLRQQVDAMRLEMHDRFNRIDEGLAAIYTTMHERFNQIDLQLGKIDGNILEIQQSLLALDLQLSRIERNNFEFLNALGRRPLLDAIHGGLGYQERTGQPMPYQPEFVEFENVLHGWGTIHAFDAVNAGPTQRNYSDAQILAELSAYPLDSNINYLNGWLVAHGIPPIANKRLASPRDWLFAARAYTQLGLEWPEHMQQINEQRQSEMSQVGQEIETAMRNISTTQTPTGPKGNTLLFSTVITAYQGKLDLMDQSLQSVENAFLNEVRAARLQRSEPFDLYGGIDQALEYVSPEFSYATCGDAGVHGSHPTPENLKSLVPNFERYNLADYLKLGKLAVCIQYQMVDGPEICYTEPEPPYERTCDIYVTTKASVTVYFDDVSLVSQSIIGANSYKTATEWYTFYGELEPNWTGGENFKAKFEALSTVDTPSPELAAQRAELLNTITGKLESALEDYQHELYGRILNEMTVGSLRTTATELAGSRALLESFVVLGFPTAVRDDEFLHAMLFGNQRLVDDSQILQSYAVSLTQPITGTQLTVNPRIPLKEVADQRRAAFEEILQRYLDAIGEEIHVESASYIAGTRRFFDLAMRVVQIEVAEPGEVAIAGLQASSDSPIVLGSATHFSVQVEQGTNVSYAWDFGDGTTGSGASPTHTYAAAGTYTVRVTASNSVSEDSVELQVRVVEPDDPDPGGDSDSVTDRLFLPALRR